MTWVKVVLSSLSAIIATEWLTIWWMLRPIPSQTKAIGVSLLFAEMRASLVHVQTWMLAILLFAVFFAASRLGSKPFRMAFFWVPTVMISSIGVTLVLSLVYLITMYKP